MVNAITGNPNNYDFGLDFNYSLWTEGTVVTLCNVPWNNDYRDIVKFTNQAALDAYIDGLHNSSIQINSMSYAKPNQPIRIDVPFNTAYRFNYLRATNPLQPFSNDRLKTFYYFITDVQYVAPNTTQLVIQLDVWQTFNRDAVFGQCYIERGHIGIANENNFANYGRDFLTIPEGIDVGSEYQVIGKKNVPIMAYNQTNFGGYEGNHAFDILVVSTADLLAPPGTESSPHLESAGGGNFFGLPSGANYYVFNGMQTDFEIFMANNAAFPWLTQCIISITVIPPVNRYINGFAYSTETGKPVLAPTQVLAPVIYNIYPNWRNGAEIASYIPDRYAWLSKFKTYPYMVVELTTWSGTPLILKPESWADNSLTVVERISPLPPNQRVAISPYKYNALPGSPTDTLIPGISAYPSTGDDSGDFMDIATVMTNLPTLAIVNNMAIDYMASNAHSIAYSYQSADWGQQRALSSNQTSYDQASGAMNLANELTGTSQAADWAQQSINQNLMANTMGLGALGNVAGGATGGAAGVGGGAANAAMSALTAGMNSAAQMASTGVSTNAKGQATKQQNQQAGYVRDTNKKLADWSAKGDYSNQIAGINAKVQDIKMTPPSVSGQVGGDTLNILNNNAVLSARIKMIDHAAMTVIGEYWLRYGYAVRKFSTLPGNLMCMSKFTYWKLTETYITSATMPESFKQVMRGIFEKGVTVWADPTYIGTTDLADNVAIGGITL